MSRRGKTYQPWAKPWEQKRALKGRDIRGGSVPEIALVVFDSVSFEKREELLFEGGRPVMLLLGVDIMNQGGKL